MTNRDLSTIVATGVLTYAAVAALTGFGVVVPDWIASVPPLVVAVALGALRVVVAVKGAENTGIDEALDRAETAIQELAAVAGRKGKP